MIPHDQVCAAHCHRVPVPGQVRGRLVLPRPDRGQLQAGHQDTRATGDSSHSSYKWAITLPLQGLGIKDFKIIKGKYKLELIIHLIHSILTHVRSCFGVLYKCFGSCADA